MLALGSAAALRASLPRIAAFAVPPEALAGTTITAEYGASGTGRLAYSVAAPDGRRLQGGDLAERSGSIPIGIPVSNQPGAFTLQMVMSGPLGTVTETRVLNAIVGKGRGSAEIQDVSVKPVVARPGQTVDVAYAATGADGTIWEQQPFSHGGQTRLVVPAVSSPREMRVLVHVSKGRSIAQSMAGLVVVSGVGKPSMVEPAIAGDDNPAAQSTSDAANGTFEVLTPTVKSGGTIRVRILSPRNGMRIALNDGQSREVAGTVVGAEADVVTLQAPAVTVPTRYTVVASFTDGFGEESIVQPVTVAP